MQVNRFPLLGQVRSVLVSQLAVQFQYQHQGVDLFQSANQPQHQEVHLCQKAHRHLSRSRHRHQEARQPLSAHHQAVHHLGVYLTVLQLVLAHRLRQARHLLLRSLHNYLLTSDKVAA